MYGNTPIRTRSQITRRSAKVGNLLVHPLLHRSRSAPQLLVALGRSLVPARGRRHTVCLAESLLDRRAPPQSLEGRWILPVLVLSLQSRRRCMATCSSLHEERDRERHLVLLLQLVAAQLHVDLRRHLLLPLQLVAAQPHSRRRMVCVHGPRRWTWRPVGWGRICLAWARSKLERRRGRCR